LLVVVVVTGGGDCRIGCRSSISSIISSCLTVRIARNTIPLKQAIITPI
jgi:hypothetical protein